MWILGLKGLMQLSLMQLSLMVEGRDCACPLEMSTLTSLKET